LQEISFTQCAHHELVLVWWTTYWSGYYCILWTSKRLLHHRKILFNLILGDCSINIH